MPSPELVGQVQLLPTGPGVGSEQPKGGFTET